MHAMAAESGGARGFARLFDVRGGEWPKVVGMGMFFFLVTMTFWVVKPIKRGLLLGMYEAEPFMVNGWSFDGPEAEQLAKALNVVAAFGAVIVFTLLTRRFRRDHVLLITCMAFAAAFLGFGLHVDRPSPGVAWSLYVFGDMFNSVMLTMFWALMNDLVRAEQAKRLYGMIGLGGVLGGFVGATVVAGAVEPLGRSTLMLVCIGPVIAIAIIGFLVHRHVVVRFSSRGEPIPPTSTRSAAIEGAMLVSASRYLIGIAGIIVLYECVSNIVDFQLASAVQSAGFADYERDEFFALVGQLTNVLAIVVQLIVTTWVVRRFGIGIALLLLPLAVLIGSAGFLAVSTLAFAVMMSAADNGLNYSINQSAKETLYVPLTRAEKYKAKAFIDMFVQRSAKLLAVGLNLAVAAYVGSAGVRLLSLVTIVLLIGWIGLVVYLGRAFERMTASAGPLPRSNP